MKYLNKIKEEAVMLLFIAVEEESINQTKDIKSVNNEKRKEVEELTEIWELVKK